MIIAKKEFIDSIGEYSLFLKPFLEKSNVEFCEWIPSEISPAASVPTLEHIVKRHERWRAVVIADELCKNQKNPFDAVGYKAPEIKTFLEYDAPMEDDNDDSVDFYIRQREHKLGLYSEYLKSFRGEKFDAYERAAQNPLTRLMTFLNEEPFDPKPSETIFSNPEYNEYVAEAEKKSALRRGILEGRTLRVNYPSEIICIAPRADYDIGYDLKTSWDDPDDSKYSRFYDWNLYYDKMRYLVFGISPETHENYTIDYIRFLYATLILANNDTPASVLHPHRVYELVCENDDDALRRLFAVYDKKLSTTAEGLSGKVEALIRTPQESLSDYDVRMEFCSKVTVPVSILDSFDQSEMYADTKKAGLATDCPIDEFRAWRMRFRASRKKLSELLKMPKRALKKATEDFRHLNTLESDRIRFLNEFQIEDIEEFVAKEEISMVETKTENIHDGDTYFNRMEGHNKAIKDKIDTRMTRKTIVILGLVVLAAFQIGFIPFIVNNANGKNIPGTLILNAAGLLILSGVAMIALVCLRRALKNKLKGFNLTMRGIVSSIIGSADQFGKYISHACNVMRGYSVLNYRAENEPEQTREIRLLRKHISDIEYARESMAEVFGPIADSSMLPDEIEEVEPYNYDFSRSTDYSYPIPFSHSDRRKIDFLQPGNTVEVPVAFVKSITVRREELYD